MSTVDNDGSGYGSGYGSGSGDGYGDGYGSVGTKNRPAPFTPKEPEA